MFHSGLIWSIHNINSFCSIFTSHFQIWFLWWVCEFLFSSLFLSLYQYCSSFKLQEVFFLQMFLISYVELQLIAHDMNEIFLSERSVWLHLFSGIHLFLRRIPLMFIITCQANFRIFHPFNKNDNFLISVFLKTFFKFHAICHNLVFANISLSLFFITVSF